MTNQKAQNPKQDKPSKHDLSKKPRARVSPGGRKLTIDPSLILVTLSSFAVRYYGLEHPRAVVFDELHYIKFITLYSKRVFFFDPQPPLGKQLLTLFAYLIGFQGDLSYTQIGDPYKPEVPIHTLRLFPCIIGTLIAPLSYLVSLELGFSTAAASLVGALVVIENSLIISSRLVLLDSIFILLSVSSLYCYLKFSKQHSASWLLTASCVATLATCTKYSGLYSYALLAILVGYSWWNSIDQVEVTTWIKRAALYCACLTIVPIAVYVAIYYAHLTWLTRAGPHDSIMTSAFQASLENGLASIIRGQPLEIVHGSQVTLRHTHGRSCWLHSHNHVYPTKYADGRGSSHQQQVTCYSFKDINNWWIVKRPHIDELVVTEPHDRIKDGDLIQLVHGLTGRTLNSHDVASAMSPFSQEVSCYVDYNISMAPQDVWRVRLLNPQDTSDHWHTINSLTQLVHHNSSSVLKFSGRQLPDWGFHQHEIVADKDAKSDDSIWNVEEHRYTKSEDQKERERQLGQAEFVPLEPTSLSFFDKFLELHYKLLSFQQEAIKDHLYASEMPLDWLFMSRGTAYWVDNQASTGNAQIFFMANVATNSTALACMSLFVVLLTSYLLMRQRRMKIPLAEILWNRLQFGTVVIASGYLVNYLPYYAYESPLFLHYYLNAYIFKVLFVGLLVQHLSDLSLAKGHLAPCIAFLIVARSVHAFWNLSPLTYGLEISGENLEKLRWSNTWQLILLNA